MASQYHAEALAAKIARKRGETMYVVYEMDDEGPYHVATAFDLDTFYAGAHVVSAVQPSGQVS